MIKKLLITYLFLITNVFAGLPPTTMRGQSQTLKPTTFNFQVPNKQATITAASTSLIETGNNNELENRGFEHVTVTTGWTISNATSSSSTTRIEGSKSLSLALTGALSLSQSSTINAAQKSGVQMVASIWVNSSDVSDLQLCSLKNGAEDKCTVTGGYVQGSGWRQLTVSFLGDSTSNGLKLKSTDTTGTVLVDQAFVGVGSPIVDFAPDMVYSAKVSSTGVVSDENTNWINGNCSVGGGTYTCPINTGVFSVVPNCVATSQTSGGSGLIMGYISSSSSATSLRIDGASGANPAAQPFILICQKQGADYKTSKAYVASSSDFGYTNAGAITITATTTNPTKGTVTVDRVFASRNGQRLKAIYQYRQTSTGSAGSGDYLFDLPSGLSFDTSIITPYTGSLQLITDPSSSIVGYGQAGNSDNNTCKLVAYSATKFRVSCLLFTTQAGVVSGYVVNSSNFTLSSSQISYNFNLDAPIQGWTDSGVIVGSFQGYNETPGTSRVETFSVSYGTTDAATACSASPCSYLDQIGSNVTSITRTTNGDYNLNLSKTYSKLKCVYSGEVSDNNVAGIGNGVVPSCSNCNTLRFVTLKASTGVSVDSNGILYCQGIPQ